jgi:2-polyprenyl-6-methoxyphenol hydroxylase-like FAD-dependent oxidoreductase
MVMRDALDARELTRLDLRDLERRYGFPYMVIHRSDLHGIFLRACERAGVDLRTDQLVAGYDNTATGARVRLADGRADEAGLVIAADGLHSVARQLLVGDAAVDSAYVAYRAAIPIEQARRHGVAENDVVVYVGPRCHFVQYPLRGGEMFNQVAVFESPGARAGQQNYGAPDELDAAFAGTCEQVRQGISLMWRDRWWVMSDRDPITRWVHGRIALLGDAAHPPLQYLAQGAIMAIEDGWALAQHAARRAAAAGGPGPGWEAALAAYQAVRAEHCRRVILAARSWGQLWHLDGTRRRQRNAILRARDTYDYNFTDWIYASTALAPDQEPALYREIPLDTVAPEPSQPEPNQPEPSQPGGLTLRTTVWCHRGEQHDGFGMLAAQAVRDLALPHGRGACWVGLEATAMRAVRRHLLGERGLEREQVHTRGYWKLGVTDHPDHDTGED